MKIKQPSFEYQKFWNRFTYTSISEWLTFQRTKSENFTWWNSAKHIDMNDGLVFIALKTHSLVENGIHHFNELVCVSIHTDKIRSSFLFVYWNSFSPSFRIPYMSLRARITDTVDICISSRRWFILFFSSVHLKNKQKHQKFHLAFHSFYRQYTTHSHFLRTNCTNNHVKRDSKSVLSNSSSLFQCVLYSSLVFMEKLDKAVVV